MAHWIPMMTNPLPFEVTVIAREKPRELAAGQVWELRVDGAMSRRCTLRDRGGDGYWSLEETGGAQSGLALLAMPEWRYLGTKEEVAAREAKAAASATVAPWEMPRPGSRAWFVAKIAAAAKVSPEDVTLRAAPEQPGMIEVEIRGRAPIEVADAIGRLVRDDIPPGMGCRAYGPIFRPVRNGDAIPESEPVAVLKWLCPNIGHPRAVRIAKRLDGTALNEGIFDRIRALWDAPSPETIGHNITAGIAAGLSRKAKPDPYPNAALHRAIDAAIAGDSGPFAHARAAALRAYAENPPRSFAWSRPEDTIAALVLYEERRGGQRAPRANSISRALLPDHVIAVYERERSRSPVHGRRGR